MSINVTICAVKRTQKQEKKRTTGLHFALHYIDKKPRRELALKLPIYCHLQKILCYRLNRLYLHHMFTRKLYTSILHNSPSIRR